MIRTPRLKAAGPAAGPGRSTDAVPLGERLRVTQMLRLSAIGLVLLCSAIAPDVAGISANAAPSSDTATAADLSGGAGPE